VVNYDDIKTKINEVVELDKIYKVRFKNEFFDAEIKKTGNKIKILH
jgi:hypothetical protein